MRNTAFFLLLSTAFSTKFTVDGITCGACSSTVTSCSGQAGTGIALKCLKSAGTVKQVCYSGHAITTGNPGFCSSSYPTGKVTFQDCQKDYKGAACTQKYCYTAHGTTITSTAATNNVACLTSLMATGKTPYSWTCSATNTASTGAGDILPGPNVALGRNCFYSKASQAGSGAATTVWGQVCGSAVQTVTFAATGTTITNTISETVGAICIGTNNPLLPIAKQLFKSSPSTKASGQFISLAMIAILLILGNL